MSKTYRRKSGEKPTWLGTEWINCYKPNGHYSHMVKVKLDPKSKEVKKELAMYHSDSWDKYSHVWPGWALAFYVQRPYRGHAAREIHKFMRDEDYEVQILSKPVKSWWD